MITIKTTPNLYGISLQGDHRDLHALYDALSYYLDFYQQHSPRFPYHEYEYLLSLNYDIRHAFMGSRGHTLVDNNADSIGVIASTIFEIPEDLKNEFATVQRTCKEGNLYFQVEILYPLVFHYLVSLERILDDYYDPSWFDDAAYQYTKLDAIRDRAQISLFTSLLWKNLQDLFGTDLALELYTYFSSQYEGSTHSMYVDAQLHHMLTAFHLYSTEEKKQYLFLSFMEIMDAEDMFASPKKYHACYNVYNSSLKSLAQKKEFPVKENFYRDFDKAFQGRKSIYHNEFDQFLDKTYGEVAFEEPDW